MSDRLTTPPRAIRTIKGVLISTTHLVVSGTVSPGAGEAVPHSILGDGFLGTGDIVEGCNAWFGGALESPPGDK